MRIRLDREIARDRTRQGSRYKREVSNRLIAPSVEREQVLVGASVHGFGGGTRANLDGGNVCDSAI
jgi:hypothetical protein